MCAFTWKIITRIAVRNTPFTILLLAALTHPAFRIGAYTFGGVRDLIHDRAWQLGLGADVTFYSKPAVLDMVYGIVRSRSKSFCACDPEPRNGVITEKGKRVLPGRIPP
jgi:hypothetical protein